MKNPMDPLEAVFKTMFWVCARPGRYCKPGEAVLHQNAETREALSRLTSEQLLKMVPFYVEDDQATKQRKNLSRILVGIEQQPHRRGRWATHKLLLDKSKRRD